MSKPTSANMLEDSSSPERTNASSEETMSPDDINTASLMENIFVQHENKVQPAQDHPIVSRPMARVSAFSAYNPPPGSGQRAGSGSEFSRAAAPMQGPLVQTFTPPSSCKFLEGAYNEPPLIPVQCGHGCCEAPTAGQSRAASSLLGPEFIDYIETPPFSSHALASIAAELNSIAWMKSGLMDSSMQDDTARQINRTGAAAAQMKNEHLRFEEGRNKLMEMMTEALPSQMPA